ncbi:3-hydroxyacyl-CoA dehydrogenase NAD-binding domain-containing protein [Lichenifustis flavocetrariae]|uniref:3-hydroxyacyl-CoA dehydrogenase NAD-binding domain-containing protein n=1 Tax=Lichenifustis flavocetrariae TaxID=2949735 RepID=A0AA41YZ85_9HYPH|nr:3-hydroxyacyl-CoA dehydrogenase NAD-binding domain-containing protein [Lichenifustis flavocetrariae]MCW6510005.1 3-hydroxyacyl-CoA dehydrogenase NAD-binding domain-containing protein [Lichenifustis flavocetrariae]
MSDDPVRLDLRGDIAVVTIDNPPVNALGQAVRAGLVRAAERIAQDAAIRGAVLVCAGRTFVAGADITEFGKPPAPPSLRDSNAALESLDKPVVAVLHGTALGGGLELALSCHYRVIDSAGVVGLPEVTLGIIPGAGGTQRLPRLIGVAPALDIITSGRRVTGEEALRLGIADAIAQGDRLAFALAFLRARFDHPLPRVSKRPFPVTDPEAILALRAAVTKKSPGQVAPARAIDVIAASAGRDFAEGQALEQEAFEALRASPQSKALRHIFFAERAIAKVPGLGTARALARIGLVGGGLMGAGIGTACLLAGLSVCLVERDATALAAGRDRIDGLLDEAVKRGKLSAEDRAAMAATRLTTAVVMAALGDADLIIEAVFESLPVKQEVFRALDRVARPGAVLATNTSYLDVAAIAAVTSRPGDVIGLHFFSPAHIMKLVEIVAPSSADPDAVATGFALVKRLGKLGVWTANAEGFIGNRILSAYRRAADQMVEDGATPWAVDAAFRDFGFTMGVFAMQDMAGLDIGWATRQRLAPTRDPAERYVAISDRLCERGWFGRKTGRGYYIYKGAGATPNPEVDAIIAAERQAKGIKARAFTSAEIQNRVLLAMINEGAWILEDGVALRAGDIDVVMVNGYGFPRWRGGPMHAAEARGLAQVKAELETLRHEDTLWRAAPLQRLSNGKDVEA